MPVPDDRCKTIEDRKQLMTRLLDLWHRNPELRFGQLLLNYFDSDKQSIMYNLEDKILIEHLERYYGHTDRLLED